MTTHVLSYPRIRSQRVAFLFVYPALGALCSIFTLIDIASLHNMIPVMFSLGELGIDWTIIPAFALILWFTKHAFVPTRLNLVRGAAMGIFFGICAGVFALFIRDTHNPSEALGFLLLGMKEEGIYRVALPIGIAFALATLGVDRKWSFRAAIVASALVFMTLPGHLAQVQQWPELLVFGAFALIMSYFTWECGAVVFAGLLHASMNIITQLSNNGAVSLSMRVLVVFVLVMALTVALPTREERLGNSPNNDDDGIVIDLRDHIVAQQRVEQLQETGN